MADIKVLDTLFRDGRQQENMEITLGPALRIIRRMADLGLHYAELGFAGSNGFVAELIEAALKEDLGQMKIAAFGRTRKIIRGVHAWGDIQEMIRLGVPVGVLVCKTRISDIYRDLNIDLRDNLKIIRESTQYLKDKGLEVILDLEHAVDSWYGRENFGATVGDFHRGRGHLYEIIDRGITAGVDCFVICDSNGSGSPEEITAMFAELKRWFPSCAFGFHGHNDNDLAIANSRAAILAGANHIQGTINGYGERCGNTNLCSLIPRLQIKDGIKVIPPEKLGLLEDFANEVASCFSKDLDVRSPFVGRNAFTTFAGMHASSEGKNAGSYLQCRPEAVGNKERIGINSQSGKSNILLVAKKLGVPLTKQQADILMSDYSEYIDSGSFNVSETSFMLTCLRVRGDCKDFFSVTKYRAETERADEGGKSSGSAVAYIDIGGKIKEQLTDGAFAKGSFDALSQVLKKILIPHFPEIQNVHLLDYRNHAIGVLKEDTGALVRVLAKFASNGNSWTTVGVSTDQTDAALRAYVAGLRWFLYNLNKY